MLEDNIGATEKVATQRTLEYDRVAHWQQREVLELFLNLSRCRPHCENESKISLQPSRRISTGALQYVQPNILKRNEVLFYWPLYQGNQRAVQETDYFPFVLLKPHSLTKGNISLVRWMFPRACSSIWKWTCSTTMTTGPKTGNWERRLIYSKAALMQDID